MVELENEADVPVSKLDERRIGHSRDVDTGQLDDSGIRAIEAAKHVEQRALAYAGCTNNRHHLARCDVDVEIPQHVNALIPDDV